MKLKLRMFFAGGRLPEEYITDAPSPEEAFENVIKENFLSNVTHAEAYGIVDTPGVETVATKIKATVTDYLDKFLWEGDWSKWYLRLGTDTLLLIRKYTNSLEEIHYVYPGPVKWLPEPVCLAAERILKESREGQ